MGDNLFNTFSFNVWKSNKEEEEKEKRNKKRRKKQVAKLKKALKEKKIGSKTPVAAGGSGNGDIEKVLRMLIDEGESDIDEEDGESDIDADLLDEVRKDAYYQPGAPHGPAPVAAPPPSMMATPSPANATPVPMMMVPVNGTTPTPVAQSSDGGSGWRHNRPPGALSQMGGSPAPPAGGGYGGGGGYRAYR